MVISIVIGIFSLALGAGLSYVLWDKALNKKKTNILKEAIDY